MAEDMDKELERTTFSCQNEILFYEKRARERWVAALSTERKLSELRKENARTRQMLANLQFEFQPSPAVPRAAHRCPEVPGDPLSHQVPQEAGGSRWEGSGFEGHMQV